MKFATTIMCLLLILNSLKAHAIDPSLNWETIETPHFSIVIDSKRHSLGMSYAQFAEQAFAMTTPVFGVWPAKTTIVVDDSTDTANGFATSLPYPMIGAYPVLPTALDSISDYGNWGHELLLHEYSHILNFEPTNGVFLPLRWIFGSIIRPNTLLPRWYSEGLAVEMETRLSQFGRLRSANYLSIIRAMVDEDTLRHENLARINETSIPDWPGGIRPYLFGALMWNEMTHLGGEQIIADLNQAYSRRLPYLLNGPLYDRLNKDYENLLNSAYDHVEAKAQKQLKQIRSTGVISEVELEHQEGFFSHSPTISPDGKYLAYVGRLHNVSSFIGLEKRDDTHPSFAGGKVTTGGRARNEKVSDERRVVEENGINRTSWLPDSSGLVYDRIETFDQHYEYSDIWKYNLNTKKQTQLTHGLRAREPVVSPDGQSIAFVQTTPGSTQLAQITISGEHLSLLYKPPFQNRISRPEFLNANQIIFSERFEDGKESLRVLNLTLANPVAEQDPNQTTAPPVTVLSEYAPAQFPKSTKQGLLFVSTRSGVANLYLASNDLKTARPITNTLTRIATGEFDASTGDLIYSRLMSGGQRLFVSPQEDWQKAPKQLALVEPLIDRTQIQTPVIPSVDESTFKPFPYNSAPYLLPHYWIPYAFITPDSSFISASTSGNDPLGRHSYALNLSYDSLTHKPSFSGQYINATTSIPVLVAVDDLHEYIYSGNFSRHSTATIISGSSFIAGLDEKWRASLGWQYLQTDLGASVSSGSTGGVGSTNGGTGGSGSGGSNGGSSLYPNIIVRNGAQAGISYLNVSQKGLEISPESGESFSLTHTHFIPSLGNTHYDQTDFSGAYYFSRWLPERNVLAGFLHASIAPDLNRAILGRTTVGGTYPGSTAQGAFVMRGYGPGTFLGKNLISSTLEYRFPLSYRYEGWGTTPLFVNRWHAALFADGLTLDGFNYDYVTNSYRSTSLGRFFIGTGGEIKADTTMFYQLKVQVTFGLYYGTYARSNPSGLLPFIGLNM
jgi:hypothetical protein